MGKRGRLEEGGSGPHDRSGSLVVSENTATHERRRPALIGPAAPLSSGEFDGGSETTAGQSGDSESENGGGARRTGVQ